MKEFCWHSWIVTEQDRRNYSSKSALHEFQSKSKLKSLPTPISLSHRNGNSEIQFHSANRRTIYNSKSYSNRRTSPQLWPCLSNISYQRQLQRIKGQLWSNGNSAPALTKAWNRRGHDGGALGTGNIIEPEYATKASPPTESSTHQQR